MNPHDDFWRSGYDGWVTRAPDMPSVADPETCGACGAAVDAHGECHHAVCPESWENQAVVPETPHDEVPKGWQADDWD